MPLALVDCDSFYASCERIFRPDLKNKPIVVLSNNDGCVIARSKEAKALGVGMGVPWFKVKDHYLKNGGYVFSSNFALYGDMSARVMNILESVSPSVEVYSIDEAFLDLDTLDKNFNLYKFGCHVKGLIKQWTGVPVRVGIAPTKTLTKVAIYQVKKMNVATRVVQLITQQEIMKALSLTPVGEVWGVGRRLNQHLQQMGIVSALDLAQCDPAYIRQKFSIVLERTVRELRGERCLEIEHDVAAKKQIVVSRSFGQRVDHLSVLQPIVSNFVVRATEKLRDEKQKCSQVSVFVRTSPFNDKKPQHRGFNSFRFSNPTNDTRDILYGAKIALKPIFRPNYSYAKAGVLLSLFSNEGIKQYSLFQDPDEPKDNSPLMKYIDVMNAYKTQIYFASQNTSHYSPVRQNMISPKYTTSWHEIPLVD
jgi:DNA polymerase V|tara:strand:+ start:535 stop:1797 length:1263 start_codon:yes stop_codon:yes gene_type:complete